MSADYVYVRRPTGAVRLLVGLINLADGIIVFILLLRFVLHLFGANPANAFMQWLIDFTGSLLAPFANIFPTWYFGTGNAIEWTTLFAAIAYAIFAYIIIWIIRAIAV